MLDKERLGEMLTFKQSPEGNEGVKERWQFGRRMGRGVGTAGAKALRRECAGDCRGTARRPGGPEQGEQGGHSERADGAQAMTWTWDLCVYPTVIMRIEQDT